MKKRNIITTNREIYEKFNMLNFYNEVVLKTVKPVQIEKIVSNINKKNNVLHLEKSGEYFIVRKVNPIDFNLYLQK